MFWRFGGYANISTLDTILDKQDVTVEELLDESDLIQELKQQNSKLVEFLREDAVLKKLLRYVVADKPPEDADEKAKEEDAKKDEDKPAGLSFFGKGKSRSRSTASKKDDGETEEERKEALRKKYAYVACEVLSSDVWSITEALLADENDLKEFWQYLRRPAPLDPLQAGYFTKVNETLLDKKTGEMLDFFRTLDNIVPAMLQHVDCPMIMDLLLKIISLDKHDGGHGIVDWLQQKDLISQLLAFLSPEHTSSTQTSAGDFLKAIITISANATTQDQTVIGPNELTRQLVSEDCISTLISEMLQGGNALTVGVGIIIEVIRKNNSDYDLDNQVGPEPKTSDPIYLGTLLRQFASHVPDFMRLIRSKSSKKPGLKVAYGGTIEPLGFDRFKTCELMAELLHCSNMGLLNEAGAEESIRKRDAERARLKAEGKLATPKAARSPGHGNSHDEFGSSVDSHGFHHARRPSDDDMDEQGEPGRRLEVQNADEDGFEKVNANEDISDDVTFDDLNEKDDVYGPRASQEDGEEDLRTSPASPTNDVEIPKPLSPNKKPTVKSNLYFDPPPTQAADSPPTAGVIDKIGKLDVDDDTVMAESKSANTYANQPEAPAPLFAKKSSGSTEESSDDQQDVSQSVATIQGDDTNTLTPTAAYEAESDQSPVVGDLLKIQFVEHHVVPTILDFFFRFPWNNFLHNVVYDVVQQVFNGTLERGYNRTLAIKLFTPLTDAEAQLGISSPKEITDRILDGQRASDDSQSNKGMRLGYMGHLTLIAEEVCKFGNRQPLELLDPIVAERVNRDEWIQYVEGTLTETRERDNAVLGGVRPENAVNRPLSIGLGGGGGGGLGGFSANAASALANAGIAPQDSLAMSEDNAEQSFEINSGSMLGGFADGEDDDEMEYEREMDKRGGRPKASEAFTDDEQAPPADTSSIPSIPPPLNVPPSRARRQLAARLAQKAKEASSSSDPDSGDAAAVMASSGLPTSPPEVELGNGDEREVFGGMGSLRSGSASRISDMFNSSDDSSTDSDADEVDEDAAGRDLTVGRDEGDFERASSHEAIARSRRQAQMGLKRRPSTTEAKERRPLMSDDEDDEEENERLGDLLDRKLVLEITPEPEVPTRRFADDGEEDAQTSSSSDDELVEIRPRRISGGGSTGGSTSSAS